MEWWTWMILGIVLAVAEVQIPTNFFLLGFGVGSLVVGVLVGLGLGGPAWFQWLGFSVTSTIAVVAFQRALDRDEGARTVTDIAGETAVVIEDVPANGVARAELRGTTWSARSAAGTPIERGTRCRVERVEGLTLWLRPE